MNNRIKKKLLKGEVLKRPEILWCVRKLKRKEWTLKMYQAVMQKNINNINK